MLIDEWLNVESKGEKKSKFISGVFVWIKERTVVPPTEMKYVTDTKLGPRRCWGLDGKFSVEVSETSIWTYPAKSQRTELKEKDLG